MRVEVRGAGPVAAGPPQDLSESASNAALNARKAQGAGTQLETGGREAQDVSRELLIKAIDNLNSAVEIVNKQLRFQLHDEAGRMMVEVIDSQTQEVIREIPPKEILEAAARMKEIIGLLLDERV